MRRAGDMFGLMRAFQKCGKSVVAYQFGGMMAPTGLFNQLTCVCCNSRKRKHLIWASAREVWKWKTHSNHRDKCVKQNSRVLSWFLLFQRAPGQIRSAKPPNNGVFRTVFGLFAVDGYLFSVNMWMNWRVVGWGHPSIAHQGFSFSVLCMCIARIGFLSIWT